MIPIGLDWDRPWQVTTDCAFCEHTRKLIRSLKGISSHPSGWCIAWLHHWCLARAWSERTLVFCRCRLARFFRGRRWASKKSHKEQKTKGGRAEREIVGEGRVRCLVKTRFHHINTVYLVKRRPQLCPRKKACQPGLWGSQRSNRYDRLCRVHPSLTITTTVLFAHS